MSGTDVLSGRYKVRRCSHLGGFIGAGWGLLPEEDPALAVGREMRRISARLKSLIACILYVANCLADERLSIACESVDNHDDRRSRRVDEDVATLAPQSGRIEARTGLRMMPTVGIEIERALL
jgi:hypothetical protein